MSEWLRKLIYRYSWDARCRNLDVLRSIKQFGPDTNSLLDVGCGPGGLSTFTGRYWIIRADIVPAAGPDFVQADIRSLPFEDAAFDLVAAVDVLEHLPTSLRMSAFKELVRVARAGIIVSFPFARARAVDETFNSRLVESGQEIPAWLDEHLANPYPDTEDVVTMLTGEASAHGRRTSVSLAYSEHLRFAKLVRWAAVRSGMWFVVVNFLAGCAYAFMPSPNRENSYRSIVTIKFSPEVEPGTPAN